MRGTGAAIAVFWSVKFRWEMNEIDKSIRATARTIILEPNWQTKLFYGDLVWRVSLRLSQSPWQLFNVESQKRYGHTWLYFRKKKPSVKNTRSQYSEIYVNQYQNWLQIRLHKSGIIWICTRASAHKWYVSEECIKSSWWNYRNSSIILTVFSIWLIIDQNQYRNLILVSVVH